MRTTKRSAAENTLRRTIGVRDAKARLSELLRDAQLGNEWTITERGRPIARIVPIDLDSASLEERVSRLVTRGVIEPSSAHQMRVPPPLPLARNSARLMLDEDRGA